MVGLIMAAMFSATASTISSQLNVFSGVLTYDIYKPLRKGINDKSLLLAGRIFTVLLGALIAGIALAIPLLGGAEKVIISITEMMVVPLLAPILLGLLSKRINVVALWTTAGVCIPLGLSLHFGWIPAPQDGGALKWLFDQSKTFVGVVLPILIALAAHFMARSEDKRWKNIETLQAAEEEVEAVATVVSDNGPARIVGWSMVVLGIGMLSLVPINPGERAVIALFSLAVIGIGIATLALSRISKSNTHT
jgi:Na+/proline symporter